MSKGTTWWQQHADERWAIEVGGANAASRVALRRHVAERGHRSVVDFGCGLAVDAGPLNAAGVSYVGVEQCAKFREAAGAYATTVERLEELADRSADAVFCRSVLEHLQAPEGALAQMARVARREIIVICGSPPGVEDELSYDEHRDLFWNVWGLRRYDAALGRLGIVNYEWRRLLTYEGRWRRDESMLIAELSPCAV